MEDFLNLSEDFLDASILFENEDIHEDEYDASMDDLQEGCGSKSTLEEETIMDEDDVLDDLMGESEVELFDIEDDYNTYSECLDFDALLEAEDVEMDVNLFCEFDEEMVGADSEDYFLI